MATLRNLSNNIIRVFTCVILLVISAQTYAACYCGNRYVWENDIAVPNPNLASDSIKLKDNCDSVLLASMRQLDREISVHTDCHYDGKETIITIKSYECVMFFNLMLLISDYSEQYYSLQDYCNFKRWFYRYYNHIRPEDVYVFSDFGWKCARLDWEMKEKGIEDYDPWAVLGADKHIVPWAEVKPKEKTSVEKDSLLPLNISDFNKEDILDHFVRLDTSLTMNKSLIPEKDVFFVLVMYNLTGENPATSDTYTNYPIMNLYDVWKMKQWYYNNEEKISPCKLKRSISAVRKKYKY